MVKSKAIKEHLNMPKPGNGKEVVDEGTTPSNDKANIELGMVVGMETPSASTSQIQIMNPTDPNTYTRAVHNVINYVPTSDTNVANTVK